MSEVLHVSEGLQPDERNGFTFWTSKNRQIPENRIYSEEVTVCNADEYTELAQYDHVASRFLGGYRSEENFMESNTMTFIVDNECVADPRYMFTLDDLHRIFDGISHIIAVIRGGLNQNDSKVPASKYLVLLKSEKIKDPDSYAFLKKMVFQRYPFLARTEMGAASYIAGTDNPIAVFYAGFETINRHLEWLGFLDPEIWDYDTLILDEVSGSSRPPLMLHFAIRILHRYGNCEKARQIYRQEAMKCSPALDHAELNSIWRTAIIFNFHCMRLPGQVPPEQLSVSK